MSVEQFVLLRVDNREVCGVSPCVNDVEQVIVTVQSQGVYLYNVREACNAVPLVSVHFSNPPSLLCASPSDSRSTIKSV